MFTGLVESGGRVEAVEVTPAGRRVAIAPNWAHAVGAGESICVSGVCLTVAEVNGQAGRLWFDVVPETLARTTLGRLAPGDRVNLERSATPSTLLGGHILQGHVDSLGRVQSVARAGERRVTVRPPADLMAYITPKGSVAIDGVSLTVARVEPGAGVFEVALIPVTLARTTLEDLCVGSEVNLEADIVAKTVVHYVRHYGGGAARS